jgi:hypothetical protein
MRPWSALVIVGALAGSAAADDAAPVPAGDYLVRVHLELPNVIRPSAGRTVTLCLPRAEAGPPIPLLSENLLLRGCPVTQLRRHGAMLTFDIVCAGRGAARARASYELTAGGFRGRIAIVLGGKNMTLTEVQDGRRLGDCAHPDDGAAP